MKKVRVGLLIDSFVVEFWVYSMIEIIKSSDFAEIVLIVKKREIISQRSYFTRLHKNVNSLFYRVYRKVENAISKPNPNAFERRDFLPLVGTVDVLEVECLEESDVDYISEVDINGINRYNIDVFIKLGFGKLRGDVLKIAKCGIWSYYHEDNLIKRGGPPGFWEVFLRKREIGSNLQMLTDDIDGREVLYRSWSTLHRFLNESLNGYYWKTSLFIPRKLKELYEIGEEEFLKKVKVENAHLEFYSSKLYKVPSNFKFLQLFASYTWDWAKLRIWKLFNFQQWILLYSLNNNKSISTSIFNYKRIVPPKDRFWADPCVIFENGTYYIFLEELFFKGSGKGHISVIIMNENGEYSAPKIILKKPYHLAYPFVFEYSGKYYLIPESCENSTIQLYHSTGFPYEWEFQMNLMENVKAVDTTIVIKDNKFWLFTSLKEISGVPYGEELFLFSSDNLFSKNWVSHPCNPVVTDVKSARPAGRIFYHNEKLYRPSQDCSYSYGYSIVINEILVLNEKEYKEIKVSDIYPNWANDVEATHTFSFNNKLTVIDAGIKRRRRLL